MSIGNERHLFAGGNTASGFHSFFDHIAPVDATRVMIIKGGPGSGKSTMMKWLSHEMQGRGFHVEYFHCSSDAASLDAIRIPQLEVSLIDGTAPHLIDPVHPGVVDEIINLGPFCDEAGIRPHKKRILATRAGASRAFWRAYRLLAAAKEVREITAHINLEKFDYGRANVNAASVIASLFGHRPISGDVGRVRHLFASAITPTGFHNYLPSLMDSVPQKVLVTGSPGTGKSTLVKKVIDAARERGYLVEAYHCGLDPQRCEHALIPALGCAVITSTPPHVYEADQATVINMDLCRHPAAVKAHEELLKQNQQLFSHILEQAIAALATAKSQHAELEAIYAPYMDFARIESLRPDLLARILATPC